MDRVGDLYPSGDVHIEVVPFLNVGDDPSLAGRLKEHFREVAHEKPEILGLLAKDANLEGIVATEMTDEFWEAFQAGKRRQLARAIESAAIAKAGGESPTVVMLIHGYRNSYCAAKTWYEPLSSRIREIDGDVHVVDVYWDGLAGGRMIKLWLNAQWNMPLVGLGMRRFLNEIDPELSLRLFAHSSGIPMLGSALGDGSQAFLKCNSEYVGAPGDEQNGVPSGCRPANRDFARQEGCYYYRVSGVACPSSPSDGDSYLIRQKRDLRLGGIAPAATLDTFVRYTPENSFQMTRMAMATNPHDSATSKFLYGRYLCKAAGSSCMAVMPKSTFDVIGKAYADRGTQIAVWNFALSEGNKTPRPWYAPWTTKHAVEGWSQNSLFEPFLRFVLTDEPPEYSSQALFTTLQSDSSDGASHSQ